MTDHSPITEDHKWFIGGKKIFQFDIASSADLSTWTLEWALRTSPTEGAALITKTHTDGLVANNGAKTITLTIDAADTVDLRPGEYSHALMRTNAGDEAILAEGPAVLQRAAVP